MPPTNIDFLFPGKPCNICCRHCDYEENAPEIIRTEDRQGLIDKIIQSYPQSSFFIYPKEISTSSYLIPALKRIQQKSVLSNGINLTSKVLENLKINGIEEIKITLFAKEIDQIFFNGGMNYHRKIIETITQIIKFGFKVTVNNVLCKTTAPSIPNLISLCSQIGVSKIEFLRLKPVGLAQNIDPGIFFEEHDMDHIVEDIETAKKHYGSSIYLSYNLSFGPNFAGKTILEATQKVATAKEYWTKSPYLCPAIGNNYWGISLQSGQVYWCFFAMTEDIASIGYINPDNGSVNIQKLPDLSKETLVRKLRGNCSTDHCLYQDLCLGGCRSTAYIFAKMRQEHDPFYAGMDICLTKSYERLFGWLVLEFRATL